MQSILLRLRKIADGAAKVILLHSEKAQPGENPRIVWILPVEGLKTRLSILQAIGSERLVGALLGRSTGQTRRCPRLRRFRFGQFGGQLRVLMGLEIVAYGLDVSRILYAIGQRLTQSGLRLRIALILLENVHAFRTRAGIICQHASQINGISSVSRITLHQRPQSIDGIGAPGRNCSLSVVISLSPVIWRRAAKHTLIYFERLLRMSALR